MIIIKIIITSMFFCPRTHLLLGDDHAVHDDHYDNALDHNGDGVHMRMMKNNEYVGCNDLLAPQVLK